MGSQPGPCFSSWLLGYLNHDLPPFAEKIIYRGRAAVKSGRLVYFRAGGSVLVGG